MEKPALLLLALLYQQGLFVDAFSLRSFCGDSACDEEIHTYVGFLCPPSHAAMILCVCNDHNPTRRLASLYMYIVLLYRTSRACECGDSKATKKSRQRFRACTR